MSAAEGGFREPGEFLVGWCPECRRDVLTYVDEQPSAGIEARRCIHCDEQPSGDLRWIDASGLSELGYAVDAGDAGGGCATCATGGCAAKAGNERGGVS